MYDIFLYPVPVATGPTDIFLRDPSQATVEPPLPPTPVPSGPAGGLVIWRGKGPVNRGRKSPWERSKTLAPTSRSKTKRLEINPEEDDIEVVEILANWLGRL